VVRGSDTTFFTKVSGTDNQEVIWQIMESGRRPDTLITLDQNPGEARLTVARDEIFDRLTIRVRSAAVSLVFMDIPITVLDATVDRVTIEPAAAVVTIGGIKTFTATVSGENKPSQEVKWDIPETDRNAGTVIEDCGAYIKLKVDENETLRSLTIRAVSVLNEKKFGVATVGIYSADGADDSSAPDAVITGVTVSPQETAVVQGYSALFTAKVAGTGSFNPNVD